MPVADPFAGRPKPSGGDRVLRTETRLPGSAGEHLLQEQDGTNSRAEAFYREQGNVDVPGHEVKLGLNVYRPRPRRPK